MNRQDMDCFSCSCLNVRVRTNSQLDFTDPSWNMEKLTEAEKRDGFFDQAALIRSDFAEVSKEQPSLVVAKRIDSWTIFWCINCSTIVYGKHEDNKYIIKKSLIVSNDELEHRKTKVNYSAVFKILILKENSNGFENTAPETNSSLTKDPVKKLRSYLFDQIETETLQVEERIRTYEEQQRAILRSYINRAQYDFEALRKVVMKNLQLNMLMEGGNENELSSERTIEAYHIGMSSVEPNYTKESPHQLISESNSQNISMNGLNDLDELSINITPSLDSELIFSLDGVDNPINGEDDDHSDEDEPSDTDDSGRDEGISIPRRRNISVAMSLPINVPDNFNPSLKWFDGQHKAKPSHRRSDDRPMDIAASIKELANSVHGDMIFGDLPPPRTGSRI